MKKSTDLYCYWSPDTCDELLDFDIFLDTTNSYLKKYTKNRL